MANDTDIDGDTLTAHLVSGRPALSFNADGTFNYSPEAASRGRFVPLPGVRRQGQQ
jgi:hypothetical protein